MVPMFAVACAWLDAAIFAVLGLIHAYWAAGGQWGRDVALPTHGAKPGQPPRFALHPTPAATALVALLLFAAAATVLGAAGIWGGESAAGAGAATTKPNGVLVAGAWILAALFFLRAVGDFRYVGVFKRIRDTRFARWDSGLFSPLCVAIAALAAITALGLG
jgi:hypothetical protein